MKVVLGSLLNMFSDKKFLSELKVFSDSLKTYFKIEENGEIFLEFFKEDEIFKKFEDREVLKVTIKDCAKAIYSRENKGEIKTTAPYDKSIYIQNEDLKRMLDKVLDLKSNNNVMTIEEVVND
jgi:D-hexose-6-phosphate mutarotase